MINVDHQNRIVRIIMTGQPDMSDIIQAFDQAVAHPEHQPGYGRLWDFRQADLSGLKAGDVEKMTRHSTRYPLGISDVRVSFLVGGKLEYGLTRMFEGLAGDTDVKTLATYSEEKALEWLTAGD